MTKPRLIDADKPDIQVGDLRDLHKDLEILCAITRNPGDPIEMVHDVVAPHALRRAIAAESLIQQKDAEIAKIKNMLLDAIGSLTMYGNDACEEQARRIARDLRKLTHVQPGQASLLQDEGDKL